MILSSYSPRSFKPFSPSSGPVSVIPKYACGSLISNDVFVVRPERRNLCFSQHVQTGAGCLNTWQQIGLNTLRQMHRTDIVAACSSLFHRYRGGVQIGHQYPD